MVKSLKKICIYIIWAAFMVWLFSGWIQSFEKPKEKTNEVMTMLVESNGMGVEEVESQIGKAKGVHKNRVYTYQDMYATYDFLIDKKVKSVVLNIKDDIQMDIPKLINEMGIREDVPEGSTIEVDGISKRTIYNVSSFSKIEVESDVDTGFINRVKITYK